MKKEEASVLAKEKAKVMVEYLEQFLSDEKKVTGHMNFSSDNSILVVDMMVKSDGKKLFEGHYNLGFSSVYADLLTEEISSLLLESFMPSDNLGVSDYARIRGFGSLDQDGFYVMNSHNSRIDINFRCKNDKFSEIMKSHNKAISDYRSKQNARIK